MMRRLGGALRRRLGQLLEALAHALAQLARGLLGEGDGRDPAHVLGAMVRVQDAGHVAVHEHLGLAGARARLEKEGRGEVTRDPFTDLWSQGGRSASSCAPASSALQAAPWSGRLCRATSGASVS